VHPVERRRRITPRAVPAPSDIDLELIEFYRATEYWVHAEPPFVLHVDEASPALARLHEAHGVTTSAFLTAYNPFSKPQDDAVNTARQATLEAELKERGLVYVHGEGRGASDEGWTEPSFLVLGITHEDACAIGARYEQNAILFAGADAVPRLVLLR
jgi:hypothetical protein